MGGLLREQARDLASLLVVVLISLAMLSCLLVARLAGGGVPARLVRRLVVEVWVAALGVCVFLSAAQVLAEQYLGDSAYIVFSGAAVATCLLTAVFILRRINRAMRGPSGPGPGDSSAQ